MAFFFLLTVTVIFIHADVLSILQEFYTATGGEFWFDNTGWNTTTIKNYTGIEVDASGNVVTLSLTGNNLTGYLPQSLGNLTTITDFEVAKNNLSGKIPDFSSFLNLQYFDIHFNNFTDIFPDYFYNFKRISQIDIGYNNISGTLNASVSNWNQLQYLGIANCSFSGPLPDLPSGIIRLWLSGNQFNGSIPSSLSALTEVQILDLSRNNFSGSVPDIFGRFAAIKDILLNNNQLSGNLPTASILKLKTLSVLAIHNNNFTALPSGIFLHPTLFAFTAQNNFITGDFPSDDVNVTVVVFANLSGPNNNFNGPIPSWALWTGAHSNQDMKNRKPFNYLERKGWGFGERFSSLRNVRKGKKTRSSNNNESLKSKKLISDDGNVLLEYFGYSKCPYYVGLTDQIQKIPVDLYPYFDLYSYFFAVASGDYPAKYWSMHGQGEAFGDYVTQCAIHLATNQSQWLSFTACVDDAHAYGDVPINTATCAAGAGYDWGAFKDCVRTTGVDYLADGTAKQLQRGVIWSPTLFFNGVQGDGDGNVGYLVKTICSLYNGTQPLPPSCG